MPVTGLEEFVREYASAVVQTAAEAYLAAAVEAAPEKTGATKASAYGPTISSEPTIITARVGFTTPQADFTDKGTQGPYSIVPVRARKLRFFWDNGPNGADWYTFDHVLHPGIQGTHWFSDLESGWEANVQDACDGMA